jgi:hypothetical protein
VESEATQDLRPGSFSVVPSGLVTLFEPNPGLASWDTLSRPSGTQFGQEFSGKPFNPGGGARPEMASECYPHQRWRGDSISLDGLGKS